MSNLRLLSEHSATSVNSFVVKHILNSDFDIYKIVINDLDQSAGGGSHNNISFVNSSGTEVTDATYEYAQLQLKSYSSFGTDKYQNQRYIRVMSQFTGATNAGANAVFYILNPTNINSYTFMLGQSGGFYASAGFLGTKSIGLLKETSSITGLRFFTQTTTTTYETIKFKVYALRIDT